MLPSFGRLYVVFDVDLLIADDVVDDGGDDVDVLLVSSSVLLGFLGIVKFLTFFGPSFALLTKNCVAVGGHLG